MWNKTNPSHAISVSNRQPFHNAKRHFANPDKFFVPREKRDLRTTTFAFGEVGRIAAAFPFFLCSLRNSQVRLLDLLLTKQKRTLWRSFLFCEKRDLNPYGVNHTPLKRARLPVPPLSHILFVLRYRTWHIILQGSSFVKTFFQKNQKYFYSFFHWFLHGFII